MSSASNSWQRELKLHHAFAASRLTEIEQLHGGSMSPSNSSAGMSLYNHEPFRFVKKREISKLTGLSGDTLKKYRLSGLLCEDIHWIRINSKVVLYNLPLMLDWLQNIHDPQAHQRAIEAYMTSLLSNQKRRQR